MKNVSGKTSTIQHQIQADKEMKRFNSLPSSKLQESHNTWPKFRNVWFLLSAGYINWQKWRPLRFRWPARSSGFRTTITEHVTKWYRTTSEMPFWAFLKPRRYAQGLAGISVRADDGNRVWIMAGTDMKYQLLIARVWRRPCLNLVNDTKLILVWEKIVIDSRVVCDFLSSQARGVVDEHWDPCM